jgi:hypothetical protein
LDIREHPEKRSRTTTKRLGRNRNNGFAMVPSFLAWDGIATGIFQMIVRIAPVSLPAPLADIEASQRQEWPAHKN